MCGLGHAARPVRPTLSGMKWLTALLLCIAALLGGLLVFRQKAAPPLGGTSLDTPVKVPPLTLTSDTGQSTTLAASDGRMRLMFFGYVHCPDICPATLASLKNTYAALSPEQQRGLQVQLVSVDPLVDTPALVHEYLGKFNPAFTGLTGTVDHINAAARALYVANVEPASHSGHASGQHGAGHTDDNVSAAEAGRIHGDEVRVITPSGEFVRVYTNQETIDGTLERDLPGLLRQYGR